MALINIDVASIVRGEAQREDMRKVSRFMRFQIEIIQYVIGLRRFPMKRKKISTEGARTVEESDEMMKLRAELEQVRTKSDTKLTL